VAQEEKPLDTVRLNVLGDLQVVGLNGVTVKLPTKPQLRQILALFGVKEQHNQSTLLAVFWPEEEPSTTLIGRLHRILTDARQLLDPIGDGDVLRTEAEVIYRTPPEARLSIESDLDEFRDLAGSTSPEDWQSALALVRGPIAADLPVRHIATDWLDRARSAQERELKDLLGKVDPKATPDTLEELCRDALEGRYVPTRHASQELPDREESTVVEDDTSTDRNDDGSRRIDLPRRRALVVGAVLFVLLFALIGISWAPWSSSSSTIPPLGSVVDAQTGQVVPHPKVTPTLNMTGEIGGGPILLPCDLAIPNCHFAKGILVAKVGDTIEFSLKLHNGNNGDVAYAKLEASRGPASQGNKVPSKELDLNMTIRWPIGENQVEEVGGHGGERPVARLQLPESGLYNFQYIPGSTELLNQEATLRHHLPDGIMDYGIALTNIGQPVNCFYCDVQYVRFVNFRAKIVRWH
jgi:hypothetical protein